MGDHRASVTLEMVLHGRTYQTDMWINYWPNNEGVDDRIVEWFSACWDDAHARYESLKAARLAAIEASEHAELARLRAKYEG